MQVPIVIRRPELVLSDEKRVIPRYLNFGKPSRIQSIVNRALRIPPAQVEEQLGRIEARFTSRHRDLETVFEENFERVARYSRNAQQATPRQRLLIGAYFTLEYSIESAALFNPSIVPHPDQSGMAPGSLRFLMSLRATGEGHISSIVFRRGVIDASGAVEFDPPPRYSVPGRPEQDRATMMDHLERVMDECREASADPLQFRKIADRVMWLLTATYRINFPHDCRPAEIVLFPATRFENRGMEDLRLVCFRVGAAIRYLGTYTAYDGTSIRPMLMQTEDFQSFRISPIMGRFAKNKGMAVFPRKIADEYCLISRHDSENLFLLRSKNLEEWNRAELLLRPRFDWELVQLGNCGSPIETDAGWVLITHGVGPMREYCIGAVLLDRADPSKVIGRLPEPLIMPNEQEREGYVPNVVYSCGSLVHCDSLVIPYAMSDSRTAFATVGLNELLDALLHSPAETEL